MLDFYLIDDAAARPDFPEKASLVLAGGLTEAVFTRLKAKKAIDERYDYYTDFRWSATIVQQLHARLSLQPVTDTDVLQLRRLLETAWDNRCGLAAWCD